MLRRPRSGPPGPGGAATLRAYRQMVTVGVLWGTIGPVAAVLHRYTSLTPLQVSLWRLFIALPPLAALAWWRARGPRPARTAWLMASAVGAVTTVSQLAYFEAVTLTGIAIATLVAVGLGPVLTAVGHTVVARRLPDRRTLAALVMAVIGLALLVVDGPAQLSIPGILLGLLSALTYAVAALLAGPTSRRMPAPAFNATAVAGGIVVLAPLAVLTSGVGLPDSAIGWLGLAHLGLIVSGVAYGLYFTAARLVPATHLTIITLLEPLTAAVIAVALFGEHLTPTAVVGGLLLLTAVAGLRPPAAVPPER